MPHEVKMPQLGMNQDSAVIVTWLKAAGDAVAEGDALFEVETDKATMEVEARAGGYLAGVRAGEGDDVPVGDLIALIVESEAEVADYATTSEAKAKAEAPDQVRGVTEQTDKTSDKVPPPASGPAPASEPGPLATRVSVTGKVLASPKAKRLALEQGIDLAALKAQGVSEPIHAADISRAAAGGQSVLAAEIPGAALNALLATGQDEQRNTLFAAFAAGAWRSLFEGQEVGIALRALDGTTSLVGQSEGPAVLSLVDLCDTRLSSYAPAGGGVTLSVARRGADYALTLAFHEGTLPMPHAVALLNDIAARVEDPIRQLL